MIRLTSIILILVFAFSSVAVPQSEETLKRWKFIDNFVDHAIALQTLTSLASIQALGKVIKVDVETYEAPHDKGLMLEKRTFYFDGLQVNAHFVQGDDSRCQLSQSVLTGAQWKVKKGLRVGTSIDRVVKVLGEPKTKSANSYEYCGETECVIFEISKEKVVRITFKYYLD